MRSVAILVQLLQEDRVRLTSRLDWLSQVLNDHRINDEDRPLLEQVFLLELEHYMDIEDQIAWLKSEVLTTTAIR